MDLYKYIYVCVYVPWILIALFFLISKRVKIYSIVILADDGLISKCYLYEFINVCLFSPFSLSPVSRVWMNGT